MAGSGQRFKDVGHTLPKPLIAFDDRPMIERVVNLFPGETNFTFICNTDHLNQSKMGKILKKIAPTGKVIGIKPHKKGPVYSIAQIFDQIDDEDEVIIHYCDVAKYWDYVDFLKHTRNRSADGAITCTVGFHPHMTTGLCYALTKADKQWFEELTEKKPLDDINSEYSSDGCYYFRSGSILKKYSRHLIGQDIRVNGEYYVSMLYNLMQQDGLKTSVYEVQHMLSMQVPQDLDEYHRWSNYFRLIVQPRQQIKKEKNSVNIIPLAGRGNRFTQEGYTVPKPLIEVNGEPMIIQASENLPPAERRIFVCLAEHLDNYPLEKKIEEVYPAAEIIRLGHVTEGQACTIEFGLQDVDPDSPVMVGACDSGALWDQKKYQKLLNDASVDAIVWTFRHHPNAKTHPEMYGWLKINKDNFVTKMSLKVPISKDPYNDHAFTGEMYFRKAKYFSDALKQLYKKDIRFKGEFYLDSTINELVKAGLKVKVFEVEHFSSWGTPDELKTYKYWQSFFHKCDWHDYTLYKDPSIKKTKIKKLDREYRKFKQKYK